MIRSSKTAGSSRKLGILALSLAATSIPACGSGSEDEAMVGGGTTGAGGAVASGGAVAAGGSPETGGASAHSGGASASGGTGPSAGGAVSSSGGSSAGGTTASGGGAAGGATAAGGAEGDGGGDGAGGGAQVTCPSPVLGPGDSNKTLMIGGSSRSYVLHVPNAYDGSEPVPLIIDFHGLGGNGQQERQSSPYPAQTDPEGVIMAFPSGLQGPSGNAWNVGPCCVANTDDVAFARALVEAIQEVACIDPKRIYAVGFSMGGGMSHSLACHAADVFAAVAPAAFDLLEENVATCQPARPITVINFRGTSDPIVPYGGGYSAVVPGMAITFLGAQNTHARWADINECQGQPTNDPNGCSTYDDCARGTTVTLCTQQGGGHSAGNASVAWPILKRHTLP